VLHTEHPTTLTKKKETFIRSKRGERGTLNARSYTTSRREKKNSMSMKKRCAGEKALNLSIGPPKDLDYVHI